MNNFQTRHAYDKNITVIYSMAIPKISRVQSVVHIETDALQDSNAFPSKYIYCSLPVQSPHRWTARSSMHFLEKSMTVVAWSSDGSDKDKGNVTDSGK